MEQKEKAKITVQVNVQAPINIVWKCWTSPSDIMKWNNASEDWHTTMATNDLRVGGKFLSRMEAKDGSVGFDFEGVYDSIKINEHIEYSLADDRKVKIEFIDFGNEIKVVETFDAENTYPEEYQQSGWQSILNNFKKYTESNL